MPFNPNEPQNGEIVDADALRGQLTGLKDLIDTGDAGSLHQPAPAAVDLSQRRLLGGDGAFVALDWSNGAPRLPDYQAIAVPVAGNIAFDYDSSALRYFNGGVWLTL